MHIAAFRQLARNKSGVANPSGSLSITATHPIDPKQKFEIHGSRRSSYYLVVHKRFNAYKHNGWNIRPRKLMLKDNDHAVADKQRHGYRFWILQFRRKVTFVNPRVFDYLGYFGLIVLSLWALFYGLGDYGIINGNESLYVESAREMALSGNWAVPTLNGLPYLEKPPLFIWLITAATSLSSSIELPPRLVTASAALLMVLGIVRFSVLLHVGKGGFAAAFILITTLGIDIMSRVAMPDMTLTALFSLGCLSAKAALQTNSLSRLRLAAGLLGAASLIKGALAPMLFGMIVIAYYYLEPPRRSDMRKLAHDPFAILLMFLPFCLWLIAIEIRLPGAANHVIVNEHIQRFLGLREPHDYYTGSPLYYVPRLFLCFFPWAGALLFGWLGKSRDVGINKQQIRRFLWLCVWIPFGFFTLSTAKANYYILLCLPAMALLTADYLPDLLRERRRFHLTMAVILPVMLLVAIWAFRIWAIRTGRTEAVISLRDGSGPLTIAVLLMLSLIALLLIMMGWRRQAILCLGGLLVPLSLQFDHLVAHAEPFMSARAMASFIQSNYWNASVYLYQDFEAVGALPIYLKRTIPVIDSRSNDLYFGRQRYPDHPNLTNERRLLAPGEEALIVVMKDRQREFADTSLAKNSIEVTTIGRAKLFRFAR